jgi:HK97 family phage major capsid protein
MAEQLNEIKSLVEGVNSSFADLRTEQENLKGRLDSLDDLKLDRMTDDITKKLEQVQEKQAKLEAASNRPGVESSEKSAESKAQFDKWLRDHKGGKSELDIQTKAMSTDVNPDGGYLVRPEFADFVVDRVFETSPLRQVARVIQIGTKSIEVLVDDDEAAARWISEGASGGETDTPEIGLKEITAHKQEADPRLTTEQIEDSVLDVEQWIQDKVSSKFARGENTSFVTGNGVGKPRGFMTYDAWAAAGTYERNKIEQVNSGSASALTADGLIDLQNALKEPYQPNAVFGMNRTTFGAALKLKGNDNYFFSPTLLKDGSQGMTLLGKRVIFMDDVAEIGSNTLSIVYADFSTAYTIVDRVGLQVLRDPYTNKGFVTYYTYKRVGGDVTNFDGIKIQKIAS